MASALDQHVNKIRALSAAGDFRELTDLLHETAEQFDKNASLLDNVLATLDNEQHSLGVLFVLVSKFNTLPAVPDHVEDIVRRVADFVLACNAEQIRFAYKTFCELCHLYTGYLTKHNLPALQAVRVLGVAVAKARQDDTQLTAVHADLLQCSLQAKCFRPALRVLETDITSIACTDDTQLDSRYFLLYYYYGGMIYTAQRQLERALYCFEVAVSTPSMAMSHIMLESYKKYILVGLLLNGRMAAVPKYASQVVSRFMKPLSAAYLELVQAMAARQADEVRQVVVKNRDVFVRDGNWGLVKQVQQSLYRKNIQRLTQTFVTLSLGDVATRVQLAGGALEAERQLLDMIKTGEIFATINQKDGMVVFHDDPRKYNTPEVMQRIQQEVTTVLELHKLIAQKEEAIMLNSNYVKKAMGLSDDDMGSGGGGGTNTGKSFPDDPAD